MTRNLTILAVILMTINLIIGNHSAMVFMGLSAVITLLYGIWEES